MSDQADAKQVPVTDDMKPITEFLVADNEQPDLIDQLIEKTKQPHIMQSTPKDSSTRFNSMESFLAWQAKGRFIHWLIGPKRDLGGIIWYGPKDFPFPEIKLDEHPDYSFAIRLYEGYVGHRLARPFMVLSIKALVAAKEAAGEKVPGIWLQTDTDNEAALAAYTKFGYKEVHRDEERVTMVLDSAAIKDIAATK